jgi:hypothetical protein
MILAQTPHTETKPEPRNGAVPCRFEPLSHSSRWRPDWLAGAAVAIEPVSASQFPEQGIYREFPELRARKTIFLASQRASSTLCRQIPYAAE